jgi:Domain of unknown function (DUF4396)
LYIYFKYGRPSLPHAASGHDHSHMHEKQPEDKVDSDSPESLHQGYEHHHADVSEHANMGHEAHHDNAQMDHSMMDHSTMDHSTMNHSTMDHSKMDHSTMDHSTMDHSHMQHTKDLESGAHVGHDHQHMTDGLPQWAIVLIGVSHCGAGCVIGDLVGEWTVFGAHDTINGQDIWPSLLVDYAFALLFGIFFQYFSIAPMSGEWGPKTLVRAAKADILSLTSFEVGLFGWMVAYQVGIWNYQLEMTTWTYWWMMQFGMLLGYATAVPVNWWLITSGIKEPCV